MLKNIVEMLNGRDYGNEITKEEEDFLMQQGIVAVFGASDDLVELRGAINDEVGCYDGGWLYLSKDGIFKECDCDCKYSKLAKDKCKKIEIIWGNSIPWTYKTDIPHLSFNIMEEGEVYCEGLIFFIGDL